MKSFAFELLNTWYIGKRWIVQQAHTRQKPPRGIRPSIGIRKKPGMALGSPSSGFNLCVELHILPQVELVGNKLSIL